MSYRILTIPPFDKQLKKLVRKYPSITKDLLNLADEILKNPKSGISLGNDCYKVRMGISSKGKGKSAGARLVTYIQIEETVIYFIAIFDKSEKENISAKEIIKLLSNIA